MVEDQNSMLEFPEAKIYELFLFPLKETWKHSFMVFGGNIITIMENFRQEIQKKSNEKEQSKT